MNYSSEIAFLHRVEVPNDPQNKRTRLDEAALLQLRQAHPNLPEAFLDYLRAIGAGCFREGQFLVQDHLFDLEDLGLAEHFDVRSGIQFFGDTFSGDFSGFDLNRADGLVVEFWHEDGSIFETGKPFNEYIRTQLLMDEHGNDLRL